MRALVTVAVVAACGKPAPPKVDVDPATPEQAKAFAASFIAAAGPDCAENLEPLLDHDAIAAKVAEHTKLSGLKHDVVADVIRQRHSGIRVLCAWLGTTSKLKLMRTGSAGPLVRKVAKDPGAKGEGVAYYTLDVGVSRTDHVVRLVDAYSYLEGATLSEMLGQIVDATVEAGAGEAFSVKDTMERIKQLRAERKGREALAELDKLPEELRRLRSVQMMRTGLAHMVSDAEYLRVLDDLARAFPNDPAVAMVEIDGAILHKDYDRALVLIDVVDKEVGGDPFQDALRSTVYFKKNDLAQAAAHADAAVAAEPTLARAHLARLDVELAQKDWAGALATIDELRKLGTLFTGSTMRASHVFDGLLASPEYAGWAKTHP